MDQVLITPIPAQVVNELASLGPLDLTTYIQAAEGAPTLRFSAELKDGLALPPGIICTSDGILTGIPAKDTHGNYEVIITLESEAQTEKTSFILNIKPSLAGDKDVYLDKLKAQVWEALENELPVPELSELLNLAITKQDIYYLLERWGTLTIWDAFNLDPASEKKPLALAGISEHYHVYDRGSSIIMTPKDLFSQERTLEDAIKTVKAMAKEVYNRNWTIEMAGLDKLVRAVWVEVQILGDQHNRRIDVINFTPSPEDMWLYKAESSLMRPEGPE